MIHFDLLEPEIQDALDALAADRDALREECGRLKGLLRSRAEWDILDGAACSSCFSRELWNCREHTADCPFAAALKGTT